MAARERNPTDREVVVERKPHHASLDHEHVRTLEPDRVRNVAGSEMSQITTGPGPMCSG